MGAFYSWFWDKGREYGFQAPVLVIIALYFFVFWMPNHAAVSSLIIGFVLAVLPFMLPILLGELLYHAWVEFRRQEDYWNTDHTVLEIKLSEDITQSPYAAELFLRALYQTGEVDTAAHGVIWGKTKPWFSLELVSTEGVVRFYVWTRTRYKDVVKAQLYAHYPTVQVVEVPDYTLSFPFDLGAMDVWGITQQLQKPDPYPIMTYVAWGLEKEKKEEFKSDPLVSLIEFMGTLGPGEHLWTQMVIRGHTNCPWSEEKTGELMNLEKWTTKEIEQLAEKAGALNEKGKPSFIALSPGDSDKVKMMQLKLNKQAFDVGIRTLYLARLEDKNSTRNAGIPTAFRSFEHGSEGRGLNGLKPNFFIAPFNFPWQDVMGIRRSRLKRRMYEAYVCRQFFFEPHKEYHIALNAEEIASLWHFPGKVAHTPTLERLPSRRGEAPANLPTGQAGLPV